MAFGVWRAEAGPGASAEGARAGEWPSAQGGGGPDAGEADPEGMKLNLPTSVSDASRERSTVQSNAKRLHSATRVFSFHRRPAALGQTLPKLPYSFAPMHATEASGMLLGSGRYRPRRERPGWVAKRCVCLRSSFVGTSCYTKALPPHPSRRERSTQTGSGGQPGYGGPGAGKRQALRPDPAGASRHAGRAERGLVECTRRQGRHAQSSSPSLCLLYRTRR